MLTLPDIQGRVGLQPALHSIVLNDSDGTSSSYDKFQDCTEWTSSAWKPGDRLPDIVIGWEINSVNALAAMRWLMAGAEMRRAALAAYWAFGFPPPSQTSRIPPTVQYLPPPPASGRPRSAPKPHCGAISGLWPIGVYDPSIEVQSDEPDPRSGLQGWKAMEQNPDRSRRDEARYLFHAALLETILVMNGIAQFRIAGFLHRVDSAFDNISDNLFDPPPGITAQWPASEGWPQNVISNLVKEQSRRWPYSEAIELGIQWSGHETGWRANWMLERSTHRMILTAQV